MPGHYHAVVWIDRREARILHFNAVDVECLVVHPHNPAAHIHHKANAIGSGHAPEDHEYLQQVGEAVADAGAILITGPANEKTELVKHIERHMPKVRSRVVAVETVDHPTDGELVAHARKHFAADHQLRGSRKT